MLPFLMYKDVMGANLDYVSGVISMGMTWSLIPGTLSSGPSKVYERTTGT